MTKLRVASIALLIVGAFVLAGVAFGVSPSDRRAIGEFSDAVTRWQHEPDFRAVEREYVTLGVRAMQVRLCGIQARTVVMTFRSIPGLPESLAVNDTSASHYDDFTRGELSAYLHLTTEQGLETGLAMIEDLGKKSPLADADVVAFLNSFKLPNPVATDAGAIASVRRLLVEVDAARPFRIRGDLANLLRSKLAGNGHQQWDEQIRAADPELWRSKQVSDFLGGIWAQGYGPIYREGIEWFWRIQWFARVWFVVNGVILAIVIHRARRAIALSVPQQREAAVQS